MRIKAAFWKTLVLSLTLSGCELCTNDIISESVSPNGLLKVVLFSRSCGATTVLNTQASILKKNQSLPNDGGNIFILDQGQATAEWRSNTEIFVSADSEARFFKKESSLHGVTIVYQTNSTPSKSH